MAWIYVAVAAAVGCTAALWLSRGGHRRAGDTVHQRLRPWSVPVVCAVVATVAAPFFADRPPVVVLTYLLALVWGVVLTFTDLEVRRLPDVLTLPAYPVSAVLLVLSSAVTGDWPALLRAVTCAGAATVSLFVLAWFNSELGLGDVKLIGVLAALLGWFSWTSAVMGLLSGFVIGGLWAAILLVSRRGGRKSLMSYGPSLILGTYLWCLLAPLS